MTQEKIKALKAKLKEYIDKYPLATQTKLAELFLKENDVPLTHGSIKRYIAIVREANEDLFEGEDTTKLETAEDESPVPPIEKLYPNTELLLENLPEPELGPEPEPEPEPESESEPEPTYDIDRIFSILADRDQVTITVGNKTHKAYPVLIDKIQVGYTRRGLNMTKGELQNVLGISYGFVQNVISKFKITKESSPCTEEVSKLLDDSDCFSYLDYLVNDLLSAAYDSDPSITNSVIKKYRKELFKLQNQELYMSELYKDIAAKLEKLVVRKETTLIDASTEITDLHIIIPDMHIGMAQDSYSYDVVREKLDEIAAEVLSYSYNRAHIYFMGDIIHSVSGLNHKDSWKNMAQGTSGAEAIIKPFELLAEFIAEVPYVHSINMVGGNHDRLASNKAEENTGEGAKLISYMLSVIYPDIKMTFDPGMVVNSADKNMNVIIMHGDYPIDKAPAQAVAWEYGSTYKFNYILTAHMHSRKLDPKDDGLRFRKEALPGFCPADDYAKTVAHPSMPGYKLAYFNDKTGLTTIDKSLIYDYVSKTL
jgi:UDP-2,3-diacylglucosamine pyrophosphatase LpxH